MRGLSDASLSAAIEPTAQGGNGINPQRRGPVSQGANLPYASRASDQQSLWRPSRNVLTFNGVINQAIAALLCPRRELLARALSLPLVLS